MALAGDLQDMTLTVARSGDVAGSAELLAESIQVIGNALGTDHPALVAPLVNLGNKLADLERFAEAETRLQEGLRIVRTSVGEEHPMIAYAFNGLANVARQTDRPEDAERYARQSWQVRSAALGALNENTWQPAGLIPLITARIVPSLPAASIA